MGLLLFLTTFKKIISKPIFKVFTDFKIQIKKIKTYRFTGGPSAPTASAGLASRNSLQQPPCVREGPAPLVDKNNTRFYTPSSWGPVWPVAGWGGWERPRQQDRLGQAHSNLTPWNCFHLLFSAPRFKSQSCTPAVQSFFQYLGWNLLFLSIAGRVPFPRNILPFSLPHDLATSASHFNLKVTTYFWRW